MSIILNSPIVAPSAWNGKELSKDDSWIYHFSDNSISDISEALAVCKSKGLKAPNINKEDFIVKSHLKKDISYFCEELENGRGFLLIRGLNKTGYNEEELAIIYYGIGLHMGIPVSQNKKGDMLGIVENIGDPNKQNTRVYETNTNLPYHTDLSDVVGLLSIRRAKTGGVSSLVSAVTVYNEIVNNHLEYLGLLYRPLYYNHMGEDLPSLTPLFSYYKGKLAFRYLRKYIEDGNSIRNVQLSKVEIEALDLIDSIAQEKSIRMDMMLEAGDIQFANNYTVMHSRTSFEDYDDPNKCRRLLRLWLKMPNARCLSSEFPGRNGIPPIKKDVS